MRSTLRVRHKIGGEVWQRRILELDAEPGSEEFEHSISANRARRPPVQCSDYYNSAGSTCVRLGRKGAEEGSDNFLAIGTNKSISRHHATIRWLKETDSCVYGALGLS